MDKMNVAKSMLLVNWIAQGVTKSSVRTPTLAKVSRKCFGGDGEAFERALTLLSMKWCGWIGSYNL